MSELMAERTSFLTRLAEVLHEKHADHFRQLAVVLPTQRSGLFLRKELARQAGKAIWSPDMLTMDRLMERISGMRSMAEDSLLLELFKVYKAIDLEKHDPFHEFMGWGSIALKHFNEVDAYLLNRDHFYKDIRSFEEIENWSLREDPLSASQSSMVERWHLHGRLHEAFIKHLDQSALGTAGMIERRCVELLSKAEVQLPWQHVCFAGLNALTAAEVKVMDALQRAGKASFAWDSDLYYYNDNMHSAGLSIRKHTNKWGQGLIEQSNELLEKERKITVAEVPSHIGMVHYATQLLREIQERDPERLKKTTLVLTDTELITPLLSALPASIGAVNVTMSVPLKKIPLTGVLSACIELNANYQNRQRVVIDELSDLLNNPVVSPHINPAYLQSQLKEFKRAMLTVIHGTAIEGFLSSEIGAIGPVLSSAIFAKDALELNHALSLVLEALKGEGASLLNEQAYQLSHTLNTLGDILYNLPEEDRQLDSVVKLWRKLVSNASVGLYGEPLQGLQIMGLLETRAIPLEHVILFPANEGRLPPSAFERSFIPFDVRRAFELPMRSDADAVISYHFYRALGSSTTMTLLADTSKAVEPKEPSRFIDQIRFELSHERTGSKTSFEEVQVQAPLIDRNHPSFKVPKNEAIIAKIKERLEHGLSPSALNTYLRCPLDFYFKYVLGLRSDDELTSDIGSNVVGSIVHKVIENCFIKQKNIQAEHIATFIADIDGQFNRAIESEKANGFLEHPRNLYPLHMAKEAALKLLKSEQDFLEQGGSLVVHGVEKEIQASAESKSGVRFKLKGTADRIETRNGRLRVVDLKTGSVSNSDLAISKWESEKIRTKDKAIQLLAYAWIYLNENPDQDAMIPVILSARKASIFPGLALKISGNQVIHRTKLPDITSLFEEIIDEMLDPLRDFEHNHDAKYCHFCIDKKLD